MLRKTAERVEGRKKLELAHLDSIFYSIDMIFHICSIFSYFSDSTICCMCVSCFSSLGIPLTSRLAQDRV